MCQMFFFNLGPIYQVDFEAATISNLYFCWRFGNAPNCEVWFLLSLNLHLSLDWKEKVLQPTQPRLLTNLWLWNQLVFVTTQVNSKENRQTSLPKDAGGLDFQGVEDISSLCIFTFWRVCACAQSRCLWVFEWTISTSFDQSVINACALEVKKAKEKISQTCPRQLPWFGTGGSSN